MPSDRERVAGQYELRRSEASWELSTGTLACPGCDAPVLPAPDPMGPADQLGCGYCGHEGPVRAFLSLGQPTRPTHVIVRVRGFALR